MNQQSYFYISSGLFLIAGVLLLSRKDGTFVIDGIRYESIPDKKAAQEALSLREIFKRFEGQRSGQGRGAEASDEGRALIKEHIYGPLDPRRADELTQKLGTGEESFWSSWFFGKVYRHNPLYVDLWSKNTVLRGYPHYKVLPTTVKIKENPQDYFGKTLYSMFSFEAPVSEGDNIISINRQSPDSFDEYMIKQSQGKSHGRVVGRVSGGTATVMGGNESGGVRESNLEVDNQGRFVDLDEKGRLKMPSGSARYTSLMKQVKVIGPAMSPKGFPWSKLFGVTCIGIAGFTGHKALTT